MAARLGAGTAANGASTREVSMSRPVRRLVFRVMLPNGRPLGAHLPLGTGMVRAADRAAAIGASALQVFSDNPTSWRRRPTLPRELPAFRERLATHGLAPLAIHAPYLVNLAGPEPELHERSVSVLANELRVAAAYGAQFVNVHVGLPPGFRRRGRHRPRRGRHPRCSRCWKRILRWLPRRRRPHARARERRGRRLRVGRDARGARADQRSGGCRRNRPLAVRLLPGHRPCLGRRLRDRHAGRRGRPAGRVRRGGWGWAGCG